MDGTQFRDIVSGRQKGVAASICRGLFNVAELPYDVAVRWRNWRFDQEHGVRRVAVPVISVGNLTVGGTGKTPMVHWLAQWFRSRGKRAVIISRGYGAEAGSRNDEALDLERQLPDVPHLQNADRVAAAEVAIEELESEVILLDDGFQHRRIHRDLDIVLLDALEPFGFEHLLPRGLLREPLNNLRRANVVAISRANLVSDQQLEAILARLRQCAHEATVITTEHAPQHWLAASGETQPLESLAQQRVVAFCGIGNPDGFWRTLEQCQLEIADTRAFPDHYAYGREDIEQLESWARQHGAAAAVCTTKDLVKLQIDTLQTTPVRALQIGLELGSDRASLEEQLKNVLAE